MQDQSDQQALHLFDQPDNQDQNNIDNEQGSPQKQQSSRKRLKKHKKDKQRKKKHHREQQEQQESGQQNGLDYLFQGQAQQNSEQQEEDGDLDDIYKQSVRPQDIYKRKTPGQSESILKRLEGKSEKEINAMYNRKLHQRRQNEVLVPSSEDHQTYSVYVKQGKQQEMVFSILKKTEHYRKTKNPKFKIQITSAMALKKKYPGKIFIEAADEKTIRQGLQGFVDINAGKITRLQHQDYTNLFVVKEVQQVQFKQDGYIRIKKGVYEDDLGKIVKLNKHSAEIMLVPRVNIQEISIRIKEQCSKLSDDKAILEKKQQMLKRFLNPRTYYPPNLRPGKKLFQISNPFSQFNVPFAQKIKLQKGGLIILSFRHQQLKKVVGSVLPVQMAAFSQDGRLFQQLKDQKIITSINFEKGEEAEIIAGELTGYFGTVEEVKENTAVIKCRTKGMEGTILEEPLDHLAKRFKQGQRVKVTSGTDKGKTGIILKLQGRHAEIWTDNENNITINKNNLQRSLGQIINQENVHNLKKDDLIKTSKNIVGIVLSTTKDNIKILSMNNTMQIINNLDFDSKINSTLLLTKNRSNQQIRNNSIVRIRQGPLEGTRCVVKHVYKDYVFLFNQMLDKTSGITVEKADNCAVLAKTADGMKKPRNSLNLNTNKTNNYEKEGNQQEDQYKIGKSIIISHGPLKGYRGVIKSVNNDRIQVRVAQKSATEWIAKASLTSSNGENNEMGKTPRRMGMSTYQQPGGMSPNNYQ